MLNGEYHEAGPEPMSDGMRMFLAIATTLLTGGFVWYITTEPLYGVAMGVFNLIVLAGIAE